MQQPSVGRIVHYVSYGTPKGEYPKACRAAIVTEVGEVYEGERVGLAVLSPEGLAFSWGVPYEEPPAGRKSPTGGTWHWPERA